MKKTTTTFLGILSLLLLNFSVKAATPLANSGKVAPNKKPASAKHVTPFSLNSPAMDNLSRWYNMGETMDAYFQGTSVLVPNYLFPDSNITAEFGTAEYGNPFVHKRS